MPTCRTRAPRRRSSQTAIWGSRALCDELLDLAWEAREGFVCRPEPLERTIARAAGAQAGSVILLDYCDAFACGGTVDTMAVLSAMLDAGLEDACAFAICDPPAVAQMKQAGPGAEVALALGGKLDMPSLRMKGKPRVVTGKVRQVSESIDMGPSAVLDTGKVEIAVVSRQVEPADLARLRALGMDPAAKRYVMLKSGVHGRAGLADLASAGVLECAGVGVCPADYAQLRFGRLRRPIYPLDMDV